MSLPKIIRILMAVVGVIAIIFLARIIGVGDTEIREGSAGGVVLPLMYIAYIALAVTVIIVLLFTIINLLKKPALLKKALINIGLFALVLIAAYVLSSGTDIDLKQFTDKGLDVTESTSKYVGMGLIAFYILTVVAVATMVFSGVKKLFNN